MHIFQIFTLVPYVVFFPAELISSDYYKSIFDDYKYEAVQSQVKHVGKD